MSHWSGVAFWVAFVTGFVACPVVFFLGALIIDIARDAVHALRMRRYYANICDLCDYALGEHDSSVSTDALDYGSGMPAHRCPKPRRYEDDPEKVFTPKKPRPDRLWRRLKRRRAA